LRKGTFDAGSFGILFPKFSGLLLLARFLESFMLWAWQDIQSAGTALRFRATMADRAGVAITRLELNVLKKGIGGFLAFRPSSGYFPQGTGSGSLLPVNVKIGESKTVFLIGLPSHILLNRITKGDPEVVLCLNQEFSVNEACVDEMIGG
jgi:hypothetical protein